MRVKVLWACRLGSWSAVLARAWAEAAAELSGVVGQAVKQEKTSMHSETLTVKNQPFRYTRANMYSLKKFNALLALRR